MACLSGPRKRFEKTAFERHPDCLTNLSSCPEPVCVPVWVVPGTLSFPRRCDSSVLMVGPGTGCAPFRAYIEERVSQGATGVSLLMEELVSDELSSPSDNLLVFGCRLQHADFFFASEWLPLVEAEKLTLLTAFSRDQVRYLQLILAVNRHVPSLPPGTQGVCTAHHQRPWGDGLALDTLKEHQHLHCWVGLRLPLSYHETPVPSALQQCQAYACGCPRCPEARLCALWRAERRRSRISATENGHHKETTVGNLGIGTYLYHSVSHTVTKIILNTLMSL